jgi:Uma2 family endonuclease
MPVLVNDPVLAEGLKADREASGADRFDEVWEGVYVMPPLANNEHQQIVTRFAAILQMLIDWLGLGDVLAGANVSDREIDWQNNYRIPDVAVLLKGTSARNLGTHWCGGPDFGIEVVSPDDQCRDKIPFYGQLGTRELLIVDRDPWLLELYRLTNGQLALVGQSSLDNAPALASTVLPLTFCLQPDGGRPLILVAHNDGAQRWFV